MQATQIIELEVLSPLEQDSMLVPIEDLTDDHCLSHTSALIIPSAITPHLQLMLPAICLLGKTDERLR